MARGQVTIQCRFMSELFYTDQTFVGLLVDVHQQVLLQRRLVLKHLLTGRAFEGSLARVNHNVTV